MKAKFMVVAIVMASMLASCGSKMANTKIETKADSLNYAIGLFNGVQIREYVLKDDTLDEKAMKQFCKGFEKAFAAEQGTPDFMKVNGFRTGGNLAKEVNEGFLFGDSTVVAKKELLVEAFEAGLMDTEFCMDGEGCMNYVQQVMGTSMFTGEPCNPTPGQADTMNMCIGYLNARQARMYVMGADTTEQDLKNFMKGFRKGLKIKKDQEKMLEGMDIAFRVAQQFGTMENFFEDEALPLNRMAIGRGVLEGINKSDKMIMTVDEAKDFIDACVKEAQEKKFGPMKAEGEKFLSENAQREGVTVTESGLQYEIITPAEGPKPTAESTVKVHYTGTLIDGKVFDSSVERGEPVEFILNRVIPGWTEGVQLMSKGAKYKFYIPYNLGYGERGAGEDIPPYSTLIFEVELLDFHDTPAEEPAAETPAE